MQKFALLTGVSAHLLMSNIDTDMIIPKQFLKTVGRDGLGQYLFYPMRYTQDGREQPEFILNRLPYRQASVLVTGQNFGCGSSREHAPWALIDFGIRCLVAPSYADIFFNNCFKNGILPITLSRKEMDLLIEETCEDSTCRIAVDLRNQSVRTQVGSLFGFSIDPFHKTYLLNGLDETELTLEKEKTIIAYETEYYLGSPWLKL